MPCSKPWESIDRGEKFGSLPQEAALLVTLQPGAYTVIVQGVAGGTGIGLVSVDDLDAFDSSSRLINISSRAYTSTGGDDQVIAGFVLQGDPKELFIAGAGPSMTKYGVPGTLTVNVRQTHIDNRVKGCVGSVCW
jgi:hypothetical protein